MTTNLVHVEMGRHRWCKLCPFVTTDMVLNARVYDSDLGMRRVAEIYKQLQQDVPRCNVSVDGTSTTDADEVYRAAPFPRMSTQAVFAPVLEWFMSQNVVAAEQSPPKTLHVHIDTRELTMCIVKPFRLLSLQGRALCSTIVTIHVHRPSNILVVSNCPRGGRRPASRPCSNASNHQYR